MIGAKLVEGVVAIIDVGEVEAWGTYSHRVGMIDITQFCLVFRVVRSLAPEKPYDGSTFINGRNPQISGAQIGKGD